MRYLTETAPPQGMEYLGRPEFRRFSGPCGVFRQFILPDSKIYPGFRHWWGVYTPNPSFVREAPSLMVFQDGRTFASRKGPFRALDVLDNLIAARELPAIVAVFVEPGAPVPGRPPANGNQRSVEYDTLSAAYGDFLAGEILPLAAACGPWTEDPMRRAIGGHSSGGICAFTAAWERPDRFGKVYSANGSFTNIRGGNIYPKRVLEEPKRPIRVYQWSDTDDMDRPDWGNWAAANKAMAAALEKRGYDHWFEFGEGSHDPIYAAARFPAAMRWLWK